MTGVRGLARSVVYSCDKVHPILEKQSMVRQMSAASQLMGLAHLTHERPDFGIASLNIDGRETAIREEVIDRTPFCTLLHFKKNPDTSAPRVLLVAPMSGHFSTLVRATVHTLLRDHDVYVTDWHNVRDVPVQEGPFDLDDFIDHIIRFLEVLGKGTHLIAVCQPAVVALAAVAVMAANAHPAQPRSLTLMAGPIDTRINPTQVNKLATSKSIEWFARNVIDSVPARYDGASRRVYPGFLQLAAFMSMNLDRHTHSFKALYQHISKGERAKADTIVAFYREYFAMMDLPAEFYLQTVRAVFQEHLLPLGRFTFRGTPVEPRAIRRTALFTVEGEKDDICAVGQTLAAQDMCRGLRPHMKQHHMQPGVGHYGVFNGRRWESQIYPRLREFVHSHD
ncbi:MAG: polyhydroxyalkanoate depolymerase [Pseudomonadota bacterium]